MIFMSVLCQFVTSLQHHCSVTVFSSSFNSSAYTELTQDSQQSLLHVCIYTHLCYAVSSHPLYSTQSCLLKNFMATVYRLSPLGSFSSILQWPSPLAISRMIQKRRESQCFSWMWGAYKPGDMDATCTQLSWQCYFYFLCIPIWYLNENDVITPQKTLICMKNYPINYSNHHRQIHIFFYS
jgi:hypothetical protein